MRSLEIISKKNPNRILKLKAPIMNAAGCFDAVDYSPYLDLNRLGAYVTKSITLKPWPGNEPPRIKEVAGGILNSIGLENKGIEIFIKTSFQFLKKYDLPVIVSIAGKTMDEYAEIAKILDQTPNVSAIEANISCPNINGDEMEFAKDISKTFDVIKQIREATSLPIIVKLSPNVTDIAPIARAAQEAGADAVSLINSIRAMAIDPKNNQPYLGSQTGGLSGPAIKPIALGMVWQVSRAVTIPVIGVGGITNTDDVLEFFAAGASAIQVGTANFTNPKVMIEIIDGLEKYFKNNQTKIFQRKILAPNF